MNRTEFARKVEAEAKHWIDETRDELHNIAEMLLGPSELGEVRMHAFHVLIKDRDTQDLGLTKLFEELATRVADTGQWDPDDRPIEIRTVRSDKPYGKYVAAEVRVEVGPGHVRPLELSPKELERLYDQISAWLAEEFGPEQR